MRPCSIAPHLVVAAVLAPHGSLAYSLVYCCVSCWGSSHCRVWGGSVPSCFAACVPPNFGLFLFLPPPQKLKTRLPNDRRGCAIGAPRSANRQEEEQHGHTERWSHTRRDKGEHSRQGGGAQQGRRGNQNSGNREPEWKGWESVRMRGSDNKGDGQPAPSLLGARATPAQPASGGGCLPQPRWAVYATGVGAHQGQTSREGEKDIWWTAGTARGGTGHLGLTHTETQRGRLRTACGQRRVDSKNSQTTPATTSTSSMRQLLGATDAQTAHPATSSTAPTHQLLGSTNAETTPARAPAAAAGRAQRPDATCEGKNG